MVGAQPKDNDDDEGSFDDKFASGYCERFPPIGLYEGMVEEGTARGRWPRPGTVRATVVNSCNEYVVRCICICSCVAQLVTAGASGGTTEGCRVTE